MKASVEYFEDEGRHHWAQVREAVARRADGVAITKVVVFTRDGLAALELAADVKTTGAKVIAVSFPAGQTYKVDGTEVTAGVTEDVRKRLDDAGCILVQGTRPFEEVVLPGCPEIKMATILSTLRLFSGGMTLCVEAVLMATDAGAVRPGEDVLAVSADTAIVAKASNKTWLFAPWGLQVREILCKPRSLTLSRRLTQEMETSEGEPEGEKEGEEPPPS